MHHNEEHLLVRILERAQEKSDAEKAVIRKTFIGLYNRAKSKRNLPNSPWYRVIKDGNKELGYWVGMGCIIRSYLTEDMTPRGREV